MKKFIDTKALWPVTMEELLMRHYQLGIFNKKISPVIFAILFPIFLGIFIGSKYLKDLSILGTSERFSSIGLMLLVFILAFILVLIPTRIVTNYGLKKFGLVCGSCKINLGAKLFSGVVVTGRCTKCGHQLVSDSSD